MRPRMQRFGLDVELVEEARARAAALARGPLVEAIARRALAGELLSDEELVALLLAPGMETDTLTAIAAARRPAGGPHLETFSPLYLTNECDAECLMCGMRVANAALARETADEGTVEAQLDLLHARGVRGPTAGRAGSRRCPRRRSRARAPRWSRACRTSGTRRRTRW